MKDQNEIVAVKCEGCFTEWYSPFFKDPCEDNAKFRKFYEENVLNSEPDFGPSLGNDELLCGDLGFLSDRLTADAEDWDAAKKAVEDAVELALKTGEEQVVDFHYTEPKVADVKITPYRRKDMPKPNEEQLKVYGPFADLMRERVAAI